MQTPRIIVFGYSEVGYLCLSHLLKCKANVVAAFTHQDNPNETQWFHSVAALAKDNGIPVFYPESLKGPEWTGKIQDLKPDLIFSFYYRKMIPTAILDLAPLGAFNMHGSYLPKYRGKAPVNWAVLHGATQMGATLHYMVKQADAGDIVDQQAVTIGPEETAFQVMEKVQAAAVQVLERQLANLLTGKALRHPQDETQATYFSGRTPEDGRIHWDQSAQQIFNLIRAVTKPYPGAFFDVGEARMIVWWAKKMPALSGTKPGQVLSVSPLSIATGDGVLQITDYQWISRNSPACDIQGPDLQTGQVLV